MMDNNLSFKCAGGESIRQNWDISLCERYTSVLSGVPETRVAGHIMAGVKGATWFQTLPSSVECLSAWGGWYDYYYFVIT